MKNLILCAIVSLFLFTSCFEKEEEVTVVPEEPIEVNILECEDVQKFIQLIENEPPREPRAIITKYKKDNNFIFSTVSGGELYVDLVFTIYRNTECEIVCRENYGVTGGGCTQEFYNELVLIDTVWQDQR